MRNPLREKLQDESKGDMDKPAKAVQELPYDVPNGLYSPDYGGTTHPYCHLGGENFDNRAPDFSLQGFKHVDATNQQENEVRNGLAFYVSPMRNNLREARQPDESKGDDKDQAEKNVQTLRSGAHSRLTALDITAEQTAQEL